MYNETHLETSLVLLDKVGNRTLASLNGSELANIAETEINRVLMILEGVGEDELSQLDDSSLISIIAQSADVKEGDYDAREEGITNLVNKLTDVSVKNIYLTQNVVLPLVDEYTEWLNTKLQATTGVSNLAMRVVTDHNSSILETSGIKNIALQFQDSRSTGQTVNAHKSPLDEASVLELIKTGVENFDASITSWIESDNVRLSKLLLTTYRNVFGLAPKQDLRKLFQSLGYESAIFAVLLARKFINETPENVNMPLVDYNNALSSVISTAGNFIHLAIMFNDEATKRGSLILRFPAKHREFAYDEVFSGENDIVVNPVVYEEYLNQGGSPEAIVGSYLTGMYTDKNVILEKKEELEQAYNTISNAGRLNRVSARLSLVKNSLHELSKNIFKDINSKFGENDPYAGVNFENADLLEDVNTFIKRLNIDDVDDVYLLVRNFICRVFFKDTHIEDLLRRVDVIAKDNEESDINYAGIISSIDLNVEWLVSQLVYETAESGTF